MVMRAVHIEAVLGYDSSSFLLALSRFASVRGWPSEIYNDPNSVSWSCEKAQPGNLAPLKVHSTMQGAVESLVKSAKRAISESL